MSASRTPLLPHASIPRLRPDEPDAFTAIPIRIGAYQLWFTSEFDTLIDSVTVCIDLGNPLELHLDDTLHLMLGLCLDLPASSRGAVVQHPRTGQLIYRFAYALHEDPSGEKLVDAMATLAASATAAANAVVH
jgi:hypothetical protein